MDGALEFTIVRELCAPGYDGKEGFTLGQIFRDLNEPRIGFTLEDEDRGLESGGEKIYGKTAMPLGRYRMTLYQSPKHGLVPLFNDVPGFTYTEIHGANRAEQLLGCVAVGQNRTADGVQGCAQTVSRIVSMMLEASASGRESFCTILRKA